MQDFPNKSTGSSFTSTEFNDYIVELENKITDTSIALNIGDTHQLGKSDAIYAVGGDFYTDSGVANAYVLSVVGSKQAAPAYIDGMRIRFRAGNSNTAGASTVNVTTIGVVGIKLHDGSNLIGGEIIQNQWIECVYYNSGGYFVLMGNSSVIRDSLVPIGTIVAHYDFNGTATFNSSIWKFCDGSVINAANSPLNTLTLPALSNRYMVGFGTEGGGNIDSAAWATAAVGNASHQVDLEHSHDSHTHTPGSLQFQTARMDSNVGGSDLYFFTAVGGDVKYCEVLSSFIFAGGGADKPLESKGVLSAQTFYTKSGSGSSAAGTTDNELSSTQSIQPRSIRVRFLMRII